MDLANPNPEILNFLAQITISLLVAIATAWITVFLSLRKFKAEALWNKKLEAYTKLLEALHVQRRASEEDLLEVTRDYEHEKEHKKDMIRKRAQAYHELHRILDIGSLIIDVKAIAYLSQALKPRYTDWEKDPPEIFYEEEENIYRRAIAQVLLIAKRDLKK